MEENHVEIVIEPYQKMVIHEIVEYRLNDFLDLILIGGQAAGGTTIPLLQWAEGIVFQIQPFNPDSEAVIEEQLKGVIHYAAAHFAIKDRFEPEVRTGRGTIRLVDTSASANIRNIAQFLKDGSQFRS